MDPQALLAPVADLLPKPLRTVRIDGVPSWRLDGDTIVLPDALLGPDPFVDPPGPTPRIDRWRRALQAVREATLAAEQAERWGLPFTETWPWMGFLVDAVDHDLPGLGLADADVAAAIAGAAPGSTPRAGVVVARWWRSHGADPAERTRAILDGVPPSREDWLAIGNWLFQPGGAAAALPVPVPKAAPRDVPCPVEPWSWIRLDVPAHRRGGYVRPEGDALVANPWAPGGQRLVTVAGALGGGGYLHAEVGGPVGRWSMASARGFGQVFGARGIEFDFRANGAWVVELAAASAGPVSAVEDTLGTSGIATGTWIVDGASTIRLAGLKIDQLGVHVPGQKSAIPGSQLGLGPVLQSMQTEPWQWKVEGGRLLLWGTMFGGSVEVWFDPAR